MNLMGVFRFGFQKFSMIQKRNIDYQLYQLINDFLVCVYLGNIVRLVINVIVCMEDKDIRYRDFCFKVIVDFVGKEYEINIAKYR